MISTGTVLSVDRRENWLFLQAARKLRLFSTSFAFETTYIVNVLDLSEDKGACSIALSYESENSS